MIPNEVTEDNVYLDEIFINKHKIVHKSTSTECESNTVIRVNRVAYDLLL